MGVLSADILSLKRVCAPRGGEGKMSNGQTRQADIQNRSLGRNYARSRMR